MKTVSALMASLVRDERGTTAMEYALIATVVALTLIIAIGFVGTGTGNLLNNVSNKTSETLTNSSNQLN